MYKRKKHHEALHHHRTEAERAVEQARARTAEAMSEASGVFAKILARIEGVPVVHRAEEVVRHRLDTPVLRVARSAVGHVLHGDLRRAYAAIRLGLRAPESSGPAHA